MAAAAAQGKLIDGKAVAAQIRGEVKVGVDELFLAHKDVPTLAVILVGERKDSATYVNMKRKACEECGIKSELVILPENVSQKDLIEKVRSLNNNEKVDGILVQLPLPKNIEESAVIDEIAADKDVDGLHPVNVGQLALKSRPAAFKPCTAEGCVELCKRNGVNLSGANVVVLGRSDIVGMPAAILFQQQDSTVTVCHSRTSNLGFHLGNADVVVAAIGKAQFVKGEWLKDGVVVIDVGINAIDDASKKSGYRLVGDVDFDSCLPKAKLITPVPGR
eukprot:GHVU01232441.1.p1 GENE.GHVU01232441.1~~GHVU01232441.1.p1  ORF type:complete len:276 (+),score=52.88 GHVU01232441.1:68-895(+)